MKKVSSNTHGKEQIDHYANQHNPNNDAYQANLDNSSNQLNPNNDEYKGDDAVQENTSDTGSNEA